MGLPKGVLPAGDTLMPPPAAGGHSRHMRPTGEGLPDMHDRGNTALHMVGGHVHMFAEDHLPK